MFHADLRSKARRPRIRLCRLVSYRAAATRAPNDAAHVPRRAALQTYK
ncbi:hypothetical protein BURMUCGD2M_5603 [Burkholderia multivorans CGD2M]|uniref:Uncharacterized protein n=1 Tax=Burkholderia multivorans CGD2 TaxID=513052 RepID=B9BKK3_9BURK|nr:hypothetical protein BURMUCGD2_5612 [Burkholderia multivorans CGD2]EEE16157.1 hypothetical protein BURMUCGD2M_5603 [Burkholderia multivorans CGD2M]